MIRRSLATMSLVLGASWPMPAAFAADDCPAALFTCETDKAGKYVQICAEEVVPGKKWSGVYYRFGAEGKAQEMVFPARPADGAKLFLFSHVSVGNDYQVTVRFNSGTYSYIVYSYSGQAKAGVRVTDSSGKLVNHAQCIERPHMFPSYLQRALACDAKGPHGEAACADKPLRLKKR